MKLQTVNKQQPDLLRENAPLLIIILTIFSIGAVAIGIWNYLEIANSEQVINEFENDVNSLVENVNKEAASLSDNSRAKNNNDKLKKDVVAKSNPFKPPLKKIDKVEKQINKKANNKQQKNIIQTRIAKKVQVLGLLGGPGKKLAILGVGSNVQIVKPGDRISSLIIKDIDQKRIIAEEYGKEITYTFGGGQD